MRGSYIANTLCDGWLMDTKHHSAPMNQYRIRRLTPVECERLQGFPDNWTKYGVIYKSVQTAGNSWQIINAQLKVAQGTLLSERQNYVLCTTNVGENGGIPTPLSLVPESLWQKQSASTAVGLAKVALGECVSDTTNLGRDTVMLSNQNETKLVEQLTRRNLISERMGDKSIYPLLKLRLEEGCPKAKLSTILISIREIIESKTCFCAETGEPIINAIVHSKKLPDPYSQMALSRSLMANIVELSDTQRYKCLGNAVTVNVITFLGQLIMRNHVLSNSDLKEE